MRDSDIAHTSMPLRGNPSEVGLFGCPSGQA